MRCYNCNGPYLRRNCPQLKPRIKKAGADDYNRGRSPTRKLTFQTESKEKTAKEGSQNRKPKVRSMLNLYRHGKEFAGHHKYRYVGKTNTRSPVKVSLISSLSEMSTVQGMVEDKPVEVL